MKRFFTQSPAQFFLYTALLFGTVYAFIVPPFQAPDEFNHFYRSWQITDGRLVAIKTNDNRVGAELPQSLERISTPFRALPFHFENKTSKDTILKLLKIPLGSDKTTFFDFPNTGLYAPTAYLPQAFIIFILKKLKCTPLSIFYATRLITLLFWAFIIYFALKTTPVAQSLMGFMALLPSSLFINSGNNADVISNALSFLIIAFVLKWLFEKDAILKRDLIIWTVATAIVSLNKIVYCPMVFLILLVEKEKFGNFKNKIAFSTIILLLNLSLIIWWISIIRPLQITFDDYNPLYRTLTPQPLNEQVNHLAQLDFISHHPFQYLKILSFSLLKSAPHTLIHYLGKFGWEKNYFPIALNFTLFLVLILRGVSDSLFLPNKKRLRQIQLSFLLVALAMTIGVATFLYLNSCAVGSDFIFNLSGKYFIPIMPFIFLALFNSALKNRLNRSKTGRFLTNSTFQRLVFIAILSYGIYAIFERYYF